MKKLVGLLVAGVLAAGALVAAPAIVPATSSASGSVADTALSLVSPDTAEAKKKKHKKKSKKAKATKGEYKKIKRGMTLAKVRKIIGSKGKRTWYYESTSSDYKCDDGYWIDGYDQPVYTWIDTSHYDYQEVWVDAHYDDWGNWVEGYFDDQEVWVEDGYEDVTYEWVPGEWIDGECWDEDLTTTYADYKWKNNKGGYVYVYFENGRVTSKSWYN